MIVRRVAAHDLAQHQQQDRHQHGADNRDGEMRGAPAIGLRAPVDQRRPECAGDIIAAGDDGHRKAAIALEPVRGFRHQRRERGRGAEAHQERDEDELPQRGRKPGQHIGARQEGDADGHRRDDAEPVGDPADDDAAEAEAEEDHGGGKRNRAAGGRKFLLHDRHHHHHRPHADRADRGDQHRQRQAAARPGASRDERRESVWDGSGCVHGGNFLAPPPGQATMRDIGHADACGRAVPVIPGRRVSGEPQVRNKHAPRGFSIPGSMLRIAPMTGRGGPLTLC